MSHLYGDRGQLAALLSGAGLVELEEATLTLDGPATPGSTISGGLLQGLGPAGAYVASLSYTDRDHYREALHARVGSPAGDFVRIGCDNGIAPDREIGGDARSCRSSVELAPRIRGATG